MKKYFATFMQKQAFKNHYVTIHADNKELARDAMFAHFGDKFMTVYPGEELADQVAQFDLKELAAIQVIDHGHGSVEYISLGKIFN